MDRHFDNTFYNGHDDEELHRFASRMSGIVLGNLVHRMTHDGLDDSEAQTLAASCYEAIAVMEAIIDTVPEDVARAARARVESKHAKLVDNPTVEISVSASDADSQLAKAIGDLLESFMGGDDE